MRKLENLVLNINEKGMQVRTTADFPAGEFGTIYTPPHRIKTDALRTGGQQWIMVCEDLNR